MMLEVKAVGWRRCKPLFHERQDRQSRILLISFSGTLKSFPFPLLEIAIFSRTYRNICVYDEVNPAVYFYYRAFKYHEPCLDYPYESPRAHKNNNKKMKTNFDQKICQNLQFHQELLHISQMVRPSFSLSRYFEETINNASDFNIQCYVDININLINQEITGPDDGSTPEDSICCPLYPSTLRASIILGIFLQFNTQITSSRVRNVTKEQTCFQSGKKPKTGNIDPTRMQVTYYDYCKFYTMTRHRYSRVKFLIDEGFN